MNTLQQVPWKGSQRTADIVREQIAQRWGDEEAQRYNPEKNCFPFGVWKTLGYRIKKGEKALRSTTLVEREVERNGNREKVRYFKTVCLFYILQVEEI